MLEIDIQRAWRDGEYFLSLTDDQKALTRRMLVESGLRVA